MPFANYQEYLDKLEQNRAGDFQFIGPTRGGGRLGALWPAFLPTPAIPTTSVALNSASLESIGFIPNLSSGQLSLLGGNLTTSNGAGVALIVIDLLNVNGGLSAAVTTPQTTNLPTVALTRYTSGEGVMAAVIIHVTVGGTAGTFTVSYTNSAGVSGRTSTATAMGGGGSADRAARNFIPIPLQAEDTGIRSIESLTFAISTGTVGNIGVCLFKPLAMIPLNDALGAMSVDAVSTGGFVGSITGLAADACISLVANSNIQQNINGSIILGEV